MVNTGGYLGIEKILLPFKCLQAAFEHMRKAGQRGVEGVALFAGVEKDNTFLIETAIVPKQKAMSLEEGLLYAVESDELYRINVWLYENKMSLIAQIHSHPTKAYHSETDNNYPIIATLGGISIVVPNFAKGPININTFAFYRLSLKSVWIELTSSEISNLIKIID